VFALLAIIWGTTWAAIRLGLTGMPPFTAVAARFAIASVVLLSLARAMRVPLGRQPHEKTLWLVNGVLFFSVSFGVVYWTEQYLPSGLTAVLFALFPLLVAVLAHFVLPGEALQRRSVLGIVTGFLGIAVIFSEDFSTLGGGGAKLAAAVLLLSPLVSAVSSVTIKKYGAGIHPISLAAVPMAICSAVMGSLAVLTERHRPVSWTPAAVGATVYLAIFGSAVTFTLYYWLLRHARASRVSLLAYLSPIIAVATGVTFFHEPLTPRIVTGAVLVIAGVALAAKARSATVEEA
jgi:drug/metabolite transporter (DMT)-like permease